MHDSKVEKLLSDAGWEVLIIWECEIKKIPKLKVKMRRFLKRHENN